MLQFLDHKLTFFGRHDDFGKKISKKMGLTLEKRKVFPENFIPHNKGTKEEKSCKYCNNIIPENSHKEQKYCSFECSVKDRTKFNYENYLNNQIDYFNDNDKYHYHPQYIDGEENIITKYIKIDKNETFKIKLFDVVA